MMGLLKFPGMYGMLALCGVAMADSDESGAYYDWTKTMQPERPYIHAYHQTLVMKIGLAGKLPDDDSKVYLTFEQALEVIKKLDNLTLGIPKIMYLVGWQHNGHDSKYPDWSVVNPRLKRAQDATAAESLRWLMAEGFKHHTTVSLHINMFDATEDSPLWKEYLARDVIAKDKDGKPLKGEVFGPESRPDTQSYQLSYAREWETGLAQKRIDGLLAMLPVQQAGTIHIDAFHSLRPIPHAYPQARYPNQPKTDTRISPFLNYPLEREIAAQRRIFRYWRGQGVDVTAEGAGFLRPDAFIGLQPMAWHYSPPADGIPPNLYCGTPMQAESEIRQDPRNLPGLIEQFCTRVVPWYYENSSALKGRQTTRDGKDLFMPALWRPQTLVAYSQAGYASKTWQLPPGWEGVEGLQVAEITLAGPQKLAEVAVKAGRLDLSLKAGRGVMITPTSGKRAAPSPAIRLYKPAGTTMGDTWYLQRGETTHLFYLQEKEQGSTRPDNDHGSMEHAISKDLIHCVELPVALRSGDPTAKRQYDQDAIFTGSAILHDDIIYNFYCGNEFVNYAPENPVNRQSMCLGTSQDGITFKKYSGNPIVEPTKGRAMVTHANEAVLADRWCDLSAVRQPHVRLVAVGKMVSLYVDHTLVIDHLLNDLEPGRLSMVAREQADFSALIYRSGKQTPHNISLIS